MKRLNNKIQRITRSRKKLINPQSFFIARVYKSTMYDYVYIVDPNTNNAKFSLSTKNIEGKNRTEKIEKLGVEIAKKLSENKISQIVFDRSGYKYHGRIKTLAESIRKNGIKF